MIAKLSAEADAALKARDRAVAEVAETAAARVKEAEAAATGIAEKVLGDMRAAAETAGEQVRAGVAEALGAAEASFARLAEQAEANQAAAEAAARQIVPATGAAGAAVAEGLSRARQQVTEFVSERIRQDIAAQTELLGCRTLSEVSAVQTRFLRTAMDQYGAEASKLARLGSDVMTRIVPAPSG
jgi:hypothetical protein